MFSPLFVFPQTVLNGWVIVTDKNGYIAIRELINSATKQICMLSYQMKVNGAKRNNIVNDLVRILIAKANSGVDVKIIMNDIFPSGILKTTQDKVLNILKKEGLNAKYAKEKKCIHGKLIIVDERKVYIGSHNWSLNAFVSNIEAGLIINNQDIGKAFLEYFNLIWGKE